MRLEPRPRPEHVLRVSAKLITSSTILQFSSDELERAVNQEQAENPALEVREQHVCPFCGMPLYGQTCSACGHFAQPALASSESPINYESTPASSWNTSQQFYERDQAELAELFRELDRRGARVLLSNSKHPLIEELYHGFNQVVVSMPRFVNCKGDRRGEVQELLVSNYEHGYTVS